MSNTLDMFLGETVAKLANGPHVGGHEAITKTLMTRLAEKGHPLSHLADQRMMKLSIGTLQRYARLFDLSFPDYVPPERRDEIVFTQRGDFFELVGPKAKAVANKLGIVVLERDGKPMCAVPAHTVKESKDALKAVYAVKLVRSKKRKAAANA